MDDVHCCWNWQPKEATHAQHTNFADRSAGTGPRVAGFGEWPATSVMVILPQVWLTLGADPLAERPAGGRSWHRCPHERCWGPGKRQLHPPQQGG
jgi:hypothetical protein